MNREDTNSAKEEGKKREFYEFIRITLVPKYLNNCYPLLAKNKNTGKMPSLCLE